MAGYAVVDLSTTGFNAAGSDRVVELAVVHVGAGGDVEREWTSLVNPLRDVGPMALHGIRPREIIEAPRLKDAAPTLLELLRGRVLVAHNANFLTKFLFFRLCSLGLWVEGTIPYLCTMEWSQKLTPGASRVLEDCCAHAGAALPADQSALARARAVADLLGGYLPRATTSRAWQDVVARGTAYRWPSPPATDAVEPRVRTTPSHRPVSWLDDILVEMPRLRDRKAESYLECVERASVLPFPGPDAAKQLLGLAGSFPLDRRSMAALHVRYLDEVALAACRHGLLEPAHVADLYGVARMLGVPVEKLDRVIDGCRGNAPRETGDPVGERILQTRR